MWGRAWCWIGLLACAFGGVAPPAGGEPLQGLQLTPGLAWQQGDHRIDARLEARARAELWDAHADRSDTFYALRTRAGLRYAWRDKLVVYAELQDARIASLAPRTSGAGALYRSSAEGRKRSRTHDTGLRAAWVELRPLPELSLRIGRQDLALGGEVDFPEPYWRYLSKRRLGQRLLGGVGFSHAGRAFDGVALRYDGRNQHLHAFAARPTTGVFDVDGALHHISDVSVAGGSWTLKRDRFVNFGELNAFLLFYDDERPPRDGGRVGETEIVTLGFSALAVLPMESSRLDVLAWAAYQWGDVAEGGRRDVRHRAFALAMEMGHQWRHVFGEPWLRLGLNLASGDGRPERGTHRTFANLLPTNHGYYGIADQVAFQNLIDVFLQARWNPLAPLMINVTLHWLHLYKDADARYAGTGVFDRNRFGYAAQPARGHGGVGTEIDVEVHYTLSAHWALEAGYAHLFGRGVLNSFRDRDVRFAYFQATLRY